jgi:hypothetical protein
MRAARREMRPRWRRRARVRVVQIRLSNSPRLRASSPVTSRRDSSAPVVWSARGAPSFPFPHPMRERSAGTARITTGHLTKAPACRCTGTRASRRSTAAIFCAITVLLRRTGGLHHSVPGSIGAALHPIVSSHQRRPPHRGRTVTAPPGTGLRIPPAGAAPCSVNQTSLDDALDRARRADHRRRQANVKSDTPVCKFLQHSFNTPSTNGGPIGLRRPGRPTAACRTIRRQAPCRD